MEISPLQLTELSMAEWNMLLSEELSTPEAVVERIKRGWPLRKFADVLSVFGVRAPEDYKKLAAELLIIDPQANAGSVNRRVANWKNGMNGPDKRADLIKLCYALKLSEADANRFLSIAGDGGFHLRSPVELLYSYGLRAGKSYAEATALLSELPAPAKSPKDENHAAYTKEVAAAFARVSNDDEFKAFVKEQAPNLGVMHNTAFREYEKRLKLLIDPPVAGYTVKSEQLSIEDTVQAYMRLSLKIEEENPGQETIAHILRPLWPNTTSVKNTLLRTIDVTRKGMMLLFVLTELDESPEYDAEEDVKDEWLFIDNEYTEEETYINRCQAINLLLKDCGMSPIDPRNLFDYTILYSLRDYDSDEGMGGRLRQLLELIFPAKDSEGNDIDE